MNPLVSQQRSKNKGMISAQEYYDDLKLNLPFIPKDEQEKIKCIQEGLFSSKKLPSSLYDINAFIAEFVKETTQDYIAFGYAGHGFSSRALHYYAKKEKLGLFIQLQYSGNRSNLESNDRINGIFYGIKLLFQAMAKAVKNGKIHGDKRLLIVQSDFYGSGWGWIEGKPERIEESLWNPETPENLAILSALLEIPD